MSLLSYIEINKQRKKLTSCLFLDIKGAYDHVNKSQLLDTCSQYLPSIYCQWISSFLSNRRHKLAFDGEIMNEFVNIDIRIPQGSPVSPILFLIYISQLFKQNNKFKGCLLLSYLDDIALAVSSSII
jgi:hypothetical protein